MAAGREPSHPYLSGGGDGEHEGGHSGTAEVEQTALGTRECGKRTILIGRKTDITQNRQLPVS